MTDDWKGENFIRQVKPANPYDGNGNNFRKFKEPKPPKVKKPAGRPPSPFAKRTAKQCVVEGCTTRLYGGNKSGVCRKHNHTENVCQCEACKVRDA